MPNNISRSLVIILSFFLGIIIDIFSNTLGMHAAACTLIGLLQQPFLLFFSDKEQTEGATPSLRSLGFGVFLRYAASMVLVHHITLLLVESMTLFDPVFLILRFLASSLLTILCILITEAFNIERKNGES